MTETNPYTLTSSAMSSVACADTLESMHWDEAAGKHLHAGMCEHARDHRRLELTTYPPVPLMPGVDATGPEYDEWLNRRRFEAHLAGMKSLTDEELAAEYWRADAGPGALRPPHPIAGNVEYEDDVMHRFATLPHAYLNGYV